MNLGCADLSTRILALKELTDVYAHSHEMVRAKNWQAPQSSNDVISGVFYNLKKPKIQILLDISLAYLRE